MIYFTMTTPNLSDSQYLHGGEEAKGCDWSERTALVALTPRIGRSDRVRVSSAVA